MPSTTRNPLARIFGRYAMDAEITLVEPVTPTMRRIRLATDEPIAFPYTPGQHIRIQLRDPLSVSGILRPAETLRTYTIWELRPDRRTLDVYVHLYAGDGIGLTWAREARVGDAVTFWWPQGDFFTREAPYQVFIGEETACAAFAPMIRALAPATEVYGVLESESPEHDVPVPGDHALRRVHRRGAPAVSSQVLLAAVAELDLPGTTGAVYLAGEAKTCQLVRNLLVRERGWPRTAIKVKPFWAPGKRGLH
ncbi:MULTISPECIES: siderophore-interacting protein [Actinoalloteichus]|uniref:Siderophore-interacting protein n=1 Tax=Actinoalloteichus fjordicus TaxID=1612552 RepID=A0AAC9LFM9_9PSEU|nr:MULTISPECIES: siderophore-interacting protein [Actinoalloteichus]APU15999.1 siderophore-interacting protein [Actinoalloteichus fjordicus]APU22062.1 siderophore-interacting protein [Actinoalloteichus sp. GBA129-24]